MCGGHGDQVAQQWSPLYKPIHARTPTLHPTSEALSSSGIHARTQTLHPASEALSSSGSHAPLVSMQALKRSFQ